MPTERLSSLDASFLYLERPAMHMHVARRSGEGDGARNVTSLFFVARPIAEKETVFYFTNFGPIQFIEPPDFTSASKSAPAKMMRFDSGETSPSQSFSGFTAM